MKGKEGLADISQQQMCTCVRRDMRRGFHYKLTVSHISGDALTLIRVGCRPAKRFDPAYPVEDVSERCTFGCTFLSFDLTGILVLSSFRHVCSLSP